MAVVAVSHSSAPPTFNLNKSPKFPPSPISATFPIPNSATSTSRIFCRATNSRTDPVKNKNNKKKKRKKTSDESLPQMNPNDDFQVLNDFPLQNGPDTSDAPIHYPSMPLPEPPAGFVLDDNGNVLHASPNRLITVVSFLLLLLLLLLVIIFFCRISMTFSLTGWSYQQPSVGVRD